MAVIDHRWLAQAARPVPRYTSYPTAHCLSGDFDQEEYRRWLTQLDGTIALYLHFPFCAERCTYCACTMIATEHRDVASRYLTLLDRETGMIADLLGDRVEVSRMHWGGGTPTYYDASQLRRAMQSVRNRFRFTEDAEISLEADPRVTSEEQLRELHELGFNRLSIGVQDIDPAVQAAIGRVQSTEITRQVVRNARACGFRSVNVDLVYGLPLQTVSRMRATIKTVIGMRPDRIAIYGYAHLPERVPNQRRIPTDTVPGVAERWALERVAREALLDAGYVAVGLDHFALPSDALAVAQQHHTLHRDFMGYTTHRSPTLVGLGVSSISELPSGFAQNVKKLSGYERALDRGRLPIEKGFGVDEDDRIRRGVIHALMCDLEVSYEQIERTYGIEFERYFASEMTELRGPGGLIEAGIARERGTSLIVEAAARSLVRNVSYVFDRRARDLASRNAVMSSAV